jgi:hypothetical protein
MGIVENRALYMRRDVILARFLPNEIDECTKIQGISEMEGGSAGYVVTKQKAFVDGPGSSFVGDIQFHRTRYLFGPFGPNVFSCPRYPVSQQE